MINNPKNLITTCGMTFSNIWACEFWLGKIGNQDWFFWKTEDGDILEAIFIGMEGNDILVEIP
jgi:hypothetical protein